MEVIMYTTTLSIITILAALLSKPSSAQTSEPDSVLLAPHSSETQLIMPVTYKNAMIGNPGAAKPSADQPAGSGVSGWPPIRFVRSNNISKSISRVSLFTRNDRFSSAIYAPMREVNNALSFVGTALQTQWEDSMVAWIQTLSLLARRQINTDLSYSIRVDDHSKFDSVISYRLDPASNQGKPSAMVSLQYHARF
jgi:hypothetical protein